MYKKAVWSILVVCLVAFGCKSKKEGAERKVGKREAEKALLLTQQQRPQFDRMSITGKAEADVPKEKFSMRFNYRIHMFNDSLIWMRFTKLGIEAVRVVISRDSVFIRDNINETYRKEGYDIARRVTGLEVDFDMLEDILLGNLNLIPQRVELRDKLTNPLLFMGKVMGTSFYYSIDVTKNKLVQLEATNIMQNQHTLIEYADFARYGNALMPESGKVKVLAPEDLYVSFNHNRIVINPEGLSANFSIPEYYKRMMDR